MNYFRDMTKKKTNKKGALAGRDTSLARRINPLCVRVIRLILSHNSQPTPLELPALWWETRFGVARYRGVEGGGIEIVGDEEHMNVDMLVSGCEIMQEFQ